MRKPRLFTRCTYPRDGNSQQGTGIHMAHGGVSRYEKFKYWEKTFFGKELDEQAVQTMARRFSELVLEKVIAAPAVPGSLAFLDAYSRKLRCWIITGTPTTEIKIIAKQRNINHYFEGLYGSPENKRHWSRHLLDTHGLNPEETLFLGDATTDQDAAEFTGLHFALRDNAENKHLFTDFNGIRFSNFGQLEALLKTKNLL